MKTIFYFIIFLIASSRTFTYEKSDAFIVRVYDKNVKILSPKKWDPRINVIIENKTLVKILGKIATDDKVLGHIAIMPGKFQARELKTKKNEKVYFISLSPPFQRVELKLGNKSYEIPPKK